MHQAFKNAVIATVLSAVSVYSVQADQVNPAAPNPVKPLPDVVADPFANAEAIPVPQAEGKSVKTGDVKYDDAQGTVEIHVNDANVVEVLRMLSAQSQKNIIASKEVRGTVTANLYGVTVKEALDAILTSNGYTYRERGNFIFVYTTKEAKEIERAARVLKTEVFRVFYTPAANAVNMIKPVLSSEAQVSFTAPAVSGISSGTGDVGGNSHAIEDMIVITDYTENLDAVGKVLKEIDKRPQQILIEATILRAGLNEDNALGVDFNLLAGVKLSNVLSNNSGQITGANAGTVAPSSGGVGSVGSGNSFSSSVPGGMKVGFVSDNVSVFLSALEGVTDTVVLANPKILALNKQKGEVIVGRKDGYLTTTVTESSTVQTVEFLDTGTRLIFRPFIGDDGYVRMEIHPEDSSGGLTGSNLPFKITTEVTSNIMVKDGHTVVIGGLFRESSDSARSQTPGLGNIPIAGMLFRQQRDRTSREEIIIMLTPHIIKDDAAFSAAAEELAKDGEKLRVGVRKGMMPWGRERLAESAYECAETELKKPNPDLDKAMWHLNCATNLNPKFLEAIKLKEKITGQTLSANDNSSMRSFIRRQVMAERERGTPFEATPRQTSIERIGAENQSLVMPVRQAGISPADREMTVSPASVQASPSTQPVAPKPVAAKPVDLEALLTSIPTKTPEAERTESTNDTTVTVLEDGQN